MRIRRPAMPPTASASPIVAALAALLALAAVGPAAGAPGAPGVPDIAWSRLDAGRGFTGGAVTAIAQDSAGLMWIGTRRGLFRYDGKTFTAFTPKPGADSLPSSTISAVMGDDRGDLWVGSDGGGLARRDARTGSFTRIGATSGAASDAAPGAPALPRGITALAKDGRGGVYVAGDTGQVFRIPAPGNDTAAAPGGAAPEEILPASGLRVTCLLVDARSRLLVGTDGGGILELDAAGRLLATRRRSESAGGLASDRISALYEDSLGFIWAGFADGGIDLVRESGVLHARPAAEGVAQHAAPGRERGAGVLVLTEDVKGRIWAGLESGGIGILEPSSMELDYHSYETDNRATSLFKDRRGLMWVGMERDGLRTGDLRSAGFGRERVMTGGRPLGSAGALAALPDGRVIGAATGPGMFAFDPRTDRISALADLPGNFRPGGTPVMHGSDDGTLLVGGEDGGLARLGVDGRWTLLVPGNAAPGRWGDGARKGKTRLAGRISAIAEPEPGRFVLADAAGTLFTLNPGGTGGPVPIGGGGTNAGADAPRLEITAMVAGSARRTWIGTANAGLFVLAPGASEPRPAAAGGRERDGIGDLRVESLFADSRGMLWVGTGGAGPVVLEERTGSILLRGQDLGIDAKSVYGFAEDRAGIIWVASSEGLYAVDGPRRYSFLFGPEDGLCPGSLDEGAIAVSARGELWLGSRGGITRFDPAAVTRYAAQPEVNLYDLEDPVTGSIPRKVDGTGITLAHDNRGLRFAIAAIDYLAPDRNRYEMRLEGRHAEWTPMGGSNSGYLAPLAPGTYMLRVRAANGNGIWNSYGASLSIRVSPPWWDTWWFRAAATGLALAAAGAAIAARIGALHRKNALLLRFARHVDEARDEERRIAARDVHDEIGQHLMALNFNAHWLDSHPAAGPEARGPVVKEMRQTIADAMASVKAIATRLRPEAFDVLEFPDAMRWYARSFERRSGIALDLGIERGWESMRREDAQALFHILQEMLGNVARHSLARAARVRFFTETGDFVLRTSDEGVGADPAKLEAQDSFGIMGMRERCAARGGRLDIRTAPGRGCTVTARIPAARDPAKPGGNGE